MRFSFAKVPARKAICFFQRVWFTFAENSPFRWNHPFTMNSGFYHKALKSWDSPFRKICILREVPDLSHWTHLFTCFDCSEDGFLYHGTHLFKKTMVFRQEVTHLMELALWARFWTNLYILLSICRFPSGGFTAPAANGPAWSWRFFCALRRGIFLTGWWHTVFEGPQQTGHCQICLLFTGFASQKALLRLCPTDSLCRRMASAQR